MFGEGKEQHMVVARGIQNHWPQSAPVDTPALLCQQSLTPPTIKFNHGWMKHWRMHCGRFVLLGADYQAHFDFFVILNVYHMAAAWIAVPHHALVTLWWQAEV